MDSNGKLGFNEQDYQMLSEKERDVDKALDGKLDKKTTTDKQFQYLYGFYGSTQITLILTQYIEGSAVPLRTSGGQITTANPTAADHAATKKYVDDAINALREELSK